jgi:hypothetical protein
MQHGAPSPTDRGEPSCAFVLRIEHLFDLCKTLTVNGVGCMAGNESVNGESMERASHECGKPNAHPPMRPPGPS